MGRTRYKIYEQTHPNFVTLSILHWIPIFTSKDSVRIVIDSLKYIQKEDKLKIYAYVILENHMHLVASSNNIIKTMQKFESYTAKELIELLKSKDITTLLEEFAFYKKKHK